MKNGSEKISLISYLVIIAFLLLVMRLWQLQILQGDEYRKLSEANRLRIISVPAPRGIIFDRNGIPLVKNAPYYFASIIPDQFDRNRIDQLAAVIAIPAAEITDKLDRMEASPFVPIRLKEELSVREIAFIEARRSDFPGLFIEVQVNREYMFGNVGAHLMGYLGKISPSQAKDPSYRNIPPDMFIGQWGIEKLFDSVLRGAPGRRIIEVNALGREIRLLEEDPPEKGNDITLSIDINLQKGAEKAFGDRAGALVAIQPDTGEILGLVSKPSFDPNLFTRGIRQEDWTALATDKKFPLLNRALQSQYPPGSTFKIVTAIAGLEEGVITPDTKVDCRGSVSFGKWRFGCWRRQGHGVVSLHRAIVESCDVYFYEVGKRLGIDRIHDYAVNLGLGKKSGIELGLEKSGLIPDTAWKLEHKKTPWFLGETFIAAIGQGYVSVTPIQLAMMTGAVANGGMLYKPALIKDARPVILQNFSISKHHLESVIKGLSGVVNEPSGTGWAAKSEITDTAGKTGTAQVVAMRGGKQYAGERFRDHAWFVAFAPVDSPEVAMAVLVEHGGHGGAAAAPIARIAIEEYMKSLRSLDHSIQR
ncbi:MAG: penicillin-binding protein 2 [Nitrospirota bacterium]